MITKFKIFEENKNVLDINGDLIEIGDYVIIPEPEDGDNWNYGDFSARVEYIDKKTNIITVVDQDDEYFDIEANRVEIEDDEYDAWLFKNWDLFKKLGADKTRNYYKDMKKYNI